MSEKISYHEKLLHLTTLPESDHKANNIEKKDLKNVSFTSVTKRINVS